MPLTDDQRAMIDAQPTFGQQMEMADYFHEDPAGAGKALVRGLLCSAVLWTIIAIIVF